MSRESEFQTRLIHRLESMFPNAIIYKTSPYAPQGFPDITICHDSGLWAYLECKADRNAKRQPNQEWYVGKLNLCGFDSFIYPDNEEEVLNGLKDYCYWGCQ